MSNPINSHPANSDPGVHNMSNGSVDDEIETFKAHHLGVAVPAVEPAIPVYEKLFGRKLISGPFDDLIQKVRVCFLSNGQPGDVVIELIAPLSDDSPVNQHLKKGLGAYHICYEVKGMDAVITDLRSKGCLLVSGPVPAVAFGGKRIAWLLMPTRQLIELVET